MIKSLIPFFFQTNLSSTFPLISLVVFCPYSYTWIRQLSAKATKCIFLGYSQLQQGYRCYSPDTHQYFVTVDVTFFENSSMFPITHPPRFDVISPPLLYPVPDTSLVPLATPPRPLQVYTRRPHTDNRPSAHSSPMEPSSTTPVLSSPVDLPIVIQKGTSSSHNPHPIYNFLTYHHLSSPYFAFVFTLSSVSGPQTMHEAFYPIRIGNRLWLRKWLLYILVALGTWWQNTCWMSLGVYSEDWPRWLSGSS